MKKQKHNLNTESGNVFFALFGAVAIVGVVTAATGNLIAGPVSTSVKLNRDTDASAKMSIAAHLVLNDSAKAPDADCDGDGLTEPVAPVACASAPDGAGCLPGASGASKSDPWNTPFAYCAYDHGVRDAVACPGRLAGENPTGPVLIAIISAGPDKVFQTTCADAPAYITKAQGSDDIVKTFSPALAMQVGGGDGVWALDPADQTKASTAKDLSINTEMNFASAAGANFMQDSRLDLGAGGLFFLPDQNALLDGQCNSINKGSVRRQSSPTTEALEICSGSEWVAVGVRNFNKLVDVKDYAGQAGRVVRYNSAENGLDSVSYDWLSLIDTPNSYTGQAGKLLAVNQAADGQNFATNMTYTAAGDLSLGGNGALKIPTGTTAQQPAAAAGMIRFNTTTSSFEGFNGSVWGGFGGGGVAGAAIFAGWPDVIICKITMSGSEFALTISTHLVGGSVMYVGDGSFSDDYLSFVQSTGAANGNGGFRMGNASDCKSKSIAQLNAANLTRKLGGSGGAFTGLDDTPSSYTGHGGKIVAVKADASGLEFVAPSGGAASIYAGWPNIIICNETTPFMGVPTNSPVPFYVARTVMGGPPAYVEIDWNMKPYWLVFPTPTAGVQVENPSGGATGRTFDCGGRNLAWFVANARTR